MTNYTDVLAEDFVHEPADYCGAEELAYERIETLRAELAKLRHFAEVQ